MRLRVSLFALLLVAGSLALPLAAHAGIPFLGPIIPTEINRCAAGWGMLITVVNNIISLLITLAIIFVAPLMIAWAGFLFVVNPVNASAKERAKKILLNTVVGIVLALAGYMIVDALMVALYNPDTPIKGGKLGAWSQLITSGGKPSCLIQEGALYKLNQVSVTGVTASGTPAGITVVGAAGQFTFDPEISAQLSTASGQLNSLLSCMITKVPAGVGRISSISDKLIASGSKSFEQCAAGGCQHAANSCHYGGRTCVGSSYAVDFGDEQNSAALTSAARTCGATYTGFEGNHLHVSVGSSCGCN